MASGVSEPRTNGTVYVKQDIICFFLSGSGVLLNSPP